MAKRIEKDSIGEIAVDADKLWGAQTQRSLENFKIGSVKMPHEIIEAIITIKKCAARVNMRAGKLEKTLGEAIVGACDKALSGGYADQFPLVVWQTGSGTQTNMNVNEVLARLAGGAHPNDHVNMSQSTNDVFPTAIHMAALKLSERLLKNLEFLKEEFEKLAARGAGVIKIGRTHLQDAAPIAFSAEVGGWICSVETAVEQIGDALKYVRRVPIGGTAVGTGLNAPDGFARSMCAELSAETGFCLEADNPYHGLSMKDNISALSSALKVLAENLMKIANDIRWLASGPRTGLGELSLPANEPGSSIMPGKVNPTQCEAVAMIAAEVMGNDLSVSVAASQGNFELNVYMPLIAFKIVESLTLLSDAAASFGRNCVAGIEINAGVMRGNFEKSLMTATALAPVIGYDRSAEIVKKAHREGRSLRECAVESGFIDGEKFDEIMAKSVEKL